MSQLDPALLFRRIANDVPQDLHQHLFVTGSLAAAYHFSAELQGQGINTKDADLVVHPAGDVVSCKTMATTLRTLNWTNHEECYPQTAPEPSDDLRAIRLYPPDSKDYFIEFLNVPHSDQQKSKLWIPVELQDGWYGIPSFRFLSVTALNRERSAQGLEYANPAMMALSNLLSHQTLGPDRIQSGGPMQGKLRSAKDLGRVLALAYLTEPVEIDRWLPLWEDALRECFPNEWKELAVRAGDGLHELIENSDALEEARQTTEIGLLSGKNVTSEMLTVQGERLFDALLEPLSDLAR